MEPTEGSTTPETPAAVEAPAPAPKSPTPLSDAQEKFENERREAAEKKAAADEALRNYVAPEEKCKEPAGESTLEIPGHVPQGVQYDEEVQGALHELGGILRESAITPEVGQSYVDVYAEYAMEHPATEVDPMNPGAVHAQLKALWGETYSTRWGHVLKAWNGLSSKSQEWVANHAEHPIAMFRTLAAIGSGAFSLSREQAQEAITKMRSERTVQVKTKDGKVEQRPAPLYDVSHPDHRLVRDTFRNLSLVANREDKPKGRQADVKEMVADRIAKEPAADSPEAKLKAEAAEIRRQPDYFTAGKNPALHNQLKARMAQIMAELYKD